MSGGVSLATIASYAAVASAAFTIYNSATADKGGGAAPAPGIAPATKLPTPENTGNAAAKLSLQEQMARRGRASTILTDDITDKLGA